MKKTTWLLAALPIVFGLAGCTSDAFEAPPVFPENPRGKVISTSLMESWSAQQVDSIISTDLSSGAAAFLNPQYGASVYKIIYQTIDPFGGLTTASGALAVPETDSAMTYPFASYQHGTEAADANVPSQRNGEVIIGLVMAASGYICAMPDYLGLGEGPGPHPYIHAKSEASAVVDMLRACRNFSPSLGKEWDGRLFLFGYSQGGHATMAAHKEIQLFHGDEFVVTASAPMAGPYDVSGVQEQVIVSFDPYPTPGYLPYILSSYNYCYNLVPDYADLLKSPYDSIVPPLLAGGLYSIGYVNDRCPAIPRTMVKDSVMDAYENTPNHPLRLALADNNLWNWAPMTPVKMFYCSSDDQVSYQNSLFAYNKFIENGSTVVSLHETANNLNHGDCALPTMLIGKLYMDSIKALPF